MREGIGLVVTGLLIGVVGAIAASRLMQSQLFGVTPFDIPTYTIAIAVIAIAGGIATWVPARRITLLNPLEVIRVE
jgi:putative ABC transport system permease protein